MPAFSVAPLPVTPVAARLETEGGVARSAVRKVRSPPVTGVALPWLATTR